MSMINILLIFSLWILSFTVSAENKKEEQKDSTPATISSFKQVVDNSWSETVTPLSRIVGEKWAFLMQQTAPHSNTLKKAVKETWSNALVESKTGKNLTDAQSAISTFITSEVNDTKVSANHSIQLIENGKLIDGIWHLSTQLLQNTDNNLAEAAQKSEIIHTLGKITALHYGGSQGAAAYASWYAYKTTKNPEIALTVGILSGSTVAGFNPTQQPSISEQLKNTIISGVMAGLHAALKGGDEKKVKEAFLTTNLLSKTQQPSEIKPEKPLISIKKPTEKKDQPSILPITTF